jgi:hypothetical protein
MKNKFLKGLVASLALAVSGFANAGVINIFDNSSFVDTDGANSSESHTVQATLTSLGYSFSLFTDYSNANLLTTLTSDSLLILPEQEAGCWSCSMDATQRNTIKDFVNTGGDLIMFGSYLYSDDFLNEIFGFSTGVRNSGTATKTASVVGTEFEDDALSLNAHSWTGELFNLPVGAITYYSDGDGSTVAKMTYGAGNIGFIGWDWWNAAPLGSKDNGWSGVLNSMIIETTKTTEVPEPSTLAIFALGLMGLASRKFKKQA